MDNINLNRENGQKLWAADWNKLISTINLIIDAVNNQSNLPGITKLSQLINDSGFITQEDVKGKVNKGELAEVATSGSYNDLKDKPSQMTGPQGPEGKSAYQVAVLNGFIGTPQLWLNSLKGEDGIVGSDGQDGLDGITPHIDPSTKHWMIGETDTGVLAEGTNGTDGITPHIDPTTKHWMIGDTDTGILAEQRANINLDEDAWKSYINTNGHIYVDLGLPSGTLWSPSTIGSNLKFTYQNYVDTTDDNPVLTAEEWLLSVNSIDTGTQAFNIQNGEPCIDGLSIGYGSAIDDVVKAKLGGDWTTPTLNDFIELFSNTTVSIFMIDDNTGLVGYKCVSKKYPERYIIIDSYKYYYGRDSRNTDSDTYCSSWSSTGTGIPTIISSRVGFNEGLIEIIRTGKYEYNYNYGPEAGFSFLGVIKTPNDYYSLKKVAVTGNYFDLENAPSITKNIYNENINFYNLNGYSSNFLTPHCLWANTILTEEISGTQQSIFKYEFYHPSTSILLSTPSWGGDWQLPSLDDLQELMDYCYATVAKNSNLEDVINLMSKNDNTLIISLPVTNSSALYDTYITRIAAKYIPRLSDFHVTASPVLEIICKGGTHLYTLLDDKVYSAEVVIVPIIKINAIAKVGITGSYNDLTDKPSLFSGSYTDLTDKPSIPAAQIQADWNQTDSTQIDYIKNKPSLATVATSGSYNDLNDKSGIFEANGHDYVEIGGVKWATMNVGATAITDRGLYYAWGETSGYASNQIGSGEGQKFFNLNDYEYNDGTYSSPNMTKYNDIDGLTTLEPIDDAATTTWGGSWRYPTKEEFVALINATNYAWIDNYQNSGISGMIFTDKIDNSKTLFFPSGGCLGSLITNDWGFYWSNNIFLPYADEATPFLNVIQLRFKNDNFPVTTDADRAEGCLIRPVLDKTYEFNRVAFTGDYNDLSNKPTIPTALIQADWNQTDNTALDYIKNKPTIPSSSGTQIQADWNQSDDNLADYIKNKPIITNGTNGKSAYLSYVDTTSDNPVLTEQQWVVSLHGTNGTNGTNGTDGITPHIDLTTGNWFIGSTDTGVHALGPAGQGGSGSGVLSDWNETDNTSLAYIANKPTIPTVPSNETATSGGNTLSVVTTGDKYNWNNKANVWQGTQAQYDALSPNYDSNTIYIITES